jgi:hypothetical protein
MDGFLFPVRVLLTGFAYFKHVRHFNDCQLYREATDTRVQAPGGFINRMKHSNLLTLLVFRS